MSYPWNPPAGVLPPRADENDFIAAAHEIGCEVAVIKAVWKVEAAGRPFRADGSVERRFEPHHFPKKWWNQIGFHIAKGQAPWKASVKLSSDKMAEQAYGLDREAMMRASSWGAPQIMGFNCLDAGYSSAESLVDSFVEGEGAHLRAFVRLVIAWGLDGALRARDWTSFARRYNGSGQVKYYAGKLAAAFGVTSTQKHAAAIEKTVRQETSKASLVVLRIGAEGRSVRALQTLLGVKVDGVFGRETEAAVIQFQKSKALKADGVVGFMTWQALEDRQSTVAPVPIDVQPVEVLTVSRTKQSLGAVIAAAIAGIASTGVIPTAALIGGGIAIGAILLWMIVRGGNRE